MKNPFRTFAIFECFHRREHQMLKNDVLDAMILVDTAVNEPLQTSKIRKTGLSIPRMACTINRNMDVMYYKTRHSEQQLNCMLSFSQNMT